MSDTTKTNGADAAQQPPTRDSAIHGLSMVFGDSVKHLAHMADAQQVAIMSMTAVLAMLPGTAQIDATRLAVIVQALTKGRKDADQMRERVATYVSMIVSLANKLPEVVEKVEAEKAKTVKSN
ncbi:hypothetical protein [Tardiphaga sp.]|jgi:hypothetical protein|uniref:hypothetical protein n=1 Tax=Tardiphaga sp. TaxID=1926292 RepID=UPI0037D9A04A